MDESYNEGFIEIERRLIEAYIKIILTYHPNLEKPKRDEIINGLEAIVKKMLEKLDIKKSKKQCATSH